MPTTSNDALRLLPERVEVRATGHCQFDQVVVGFVRQIRSPGVIHPGPLAAGQKNVEQLGALLWVQRAALKEVGTPKNVLIFVEQGVAHQR